MAPRATTVWNEWTAKKYRTMIEQRYNSFLRRFSHKEAIGCVDAAFIKLIENGYGAIGETLVVKFAHKLNEYFITYRKNQGD